MNKKTAEKLILKWLSRLYLENYTFQFTVEKPTRKQLDTTVHTSEEACVLSMPDEKAAKITFNSNRFKNLKEEIIVHELVHIPFAKISNLINSSNLGKKKKALYERYEEESVELFTKIIYSMRLE